MRRAEPSRTRELAARSRPTRPNGRYRSSKITRILQNSLGGNALSTIVCNVTPANWHTDESHNPLRFAARAKNLHTVLVRQECIEPEKLLRK